MSSTNTPQITLYTAATPNGYKISVFLEELGIPYKAVPINITTGEQKEPWFLKINPNGRNDFKVFESGAILIYLAEHYDKENKFLPKDDNLRSEVIQWLMFQMAGVGPMQGQANHFSRFAKEKIPYAIQRYQDETKRLYKVLDDRLQGREYLVGDHLSIADIVHFPWIKIHEFSGVAIDEFTNLKAWLERIATRPSVEKGYNVVPRK
nr:5573_t:CDS:2 [Entrophospora candida]